MSGTIFEELWNSSVPFPDELTPKSVKVELEVRDANFPLNFVVPYAPTSKHFPLSATKSPSYVTVGFEDYWLDPDSYLTDSANDTFPDTVTGVLIG